MSGDHDPVEALREAREGTTAGPWKVGPVFDDAFVLVASDDHFVLRTVAGNDKANAAFVIAAKNHVPALLALVEELTRERDGWKDSFERIGKVVNPLAEESNDLEEKLSAARAEADALRAKANNAAEVLRVAGTLLRQSGSLLDRHQGDACHAVATDLLTPDSADPRSEAGEVNDGV